MVPRSRANGWSGSSVDDEKEPGWREDAGSSHVKRKDCDNTHSERRSDGMLKEDDQVERRSNGRKREVRGEAEQRFLQPEYEDAIETKGVSSGSSRSSRASSRQSAKPVVDRASSRNGNREREEVRGSQYASSTRRVRRIVNTPLRAKSQAAAVSSIREEEEEEEDEASDRDTPPGLRPGSGGRGVGASSGGPSRWRGQSSRHVPDSEDYSRERTEASRKPHYYSTKRRTSRRQDYNSEDNSEAAYRPEEEDEEEVDGQQSGSYHNDKYHNKNRIATDDIPEERQREARYEDRTMMSTSHGGGEYEDGGPIGVGSSGAKQYWQQQPQQQRSSSSSSSFSGHQSSSAPFVPSSYVVDGRSRGTRSLYSAQQSQHRESVREAVSGNRDGTARQMEVVGDSNAPDDLQAEYRRHPPLRPAPALSSSAAGMKLAGASMYKNDARPQQLDNLSDQVAAVERRLEDSVRLQEAIMDKLLSVADQCNRMGTALEGVESRIATLTSTAALLGQQLNGLPPASAHKTAPSDLRVSNEYHHDVVEQSKLMHHNFPDEGRSFHRPVSPSDSMAPSRRDRSAGTTGEKATNSRSAFAQNHIDPSPTYPVFTGHQYQGPPNQNVFKSPPSAFYQQASQQSLHHVSGNDVSQTNITTAKTGRGGVMAPPPPSRREEPRCAVADSASSTPPHVGVRSTSKMQQHYSDYHPQAGGAMRSTRLSEDANGGTVAYTKETAVVLRRQKEVLSGTDHRQRASTVVDERGGRSSDDGGRAQAHEAANNPAALALVSRDEAQERLIKNHAAESGKSGTAMLVPAVRKKVVLAYEPPADRTDTATIVRLDVGDIVYAYGKRDEWMFVWKENDPKHKGWYPMSYLD